MGRLASIGGRALVAVALMTPAGPGHPLVHAQSTDMDTTNPIIALLESGQAVFGVFSGDQTPERGAIVSRLEMADFVFYSLESGPFDIPTLEAFLDGMRGDDGRLSHPLLLRIPPLADEEVARTQVARALGAGVSGIVFPHVATSDQAAAAVRVVPGLWPADEAGRVVGFLIVEDREGVENASGIVATRGPSVVFAGPGDLSRAYDGDMEAVERAIQTVLAACLDLNVPCGITAGVDDIADRIAQGFRVIIVTSEAALPAGRAAAGR